MTAFMIYLLVGALWALLCKLSGEIDKALEEDDFMSNTLGWHLFFFVAITIFWAPLLIMWGLSLRKGDDE